MPNTRTLIAFHQARKRLETLLDPAPTVNEITVWIDYGDPLTIDRLKKVHANSANAKIPTGLSGYHKNGEAFHLAKILLTLPEQGGHRFGNPLGTEAHVIEALHRTYFDADEINQFEPDERYLRWDQLCARWSNQTGEREVAAFIHARVDDGDLDPVHPIPSDLQRQALSVCAMSQIQKIEIQHFGAPQVASTSRERNSRGAKDCHTWLLAQMKAGLPLKSKSEYRSEAQALFPVSTRAFNFAWATAAGQSKSMAWITPGRRKKPI